MPSPQQTHQLSFGPDRVTKRYTSWDRGEADREWRGLTLLAEHAPGFAPKPLRRGTAAGAPTVEMSRLPGAPLGAEPLSPAQLEAVGRAVRALHGVPPDAVRAACLGERLDGPSRFTGWVREWSLAPVSLDGAQDAATVARALRVAGDWLSHCGLGPVAAEDQVFGAADGNPANLLWDGAVCRRVDLEDCGLSDPAFEAADCVEHVAARLRGVLRPDDLASAVGLTPDQRDRFAECRRLLACFWLLMLLPGNRGFARNPGGSVEDQARHVLILLGRD